jgi:hypothetical protein
MTGLVPDPETDARPILVLYSFVSRFKHEFSVGTATGLDQYSRGEHTMQQALK